MLNASFLSVFGAGVRYEWNYPASVLCLPYLRVGLDTALFLDRHSTSVDLLFT